MRFMRAPRALPSAAALALLVACVHRKPAEPPATRALADALRGALTENRLDEAAALATRIEADGNRRRAWIARLTIARRRLDQAQLAALGPPPPDTDDLGAL